MAWESKSQWLERLGRAVADCRDCAIRAIPTENGIYECRARLAEFIKLMGTKGFSVHAGSVDVMLSEDIDKLCVYYGLDA